LTSSSTHVDSYYRHVSPQLLARVRQLWSSRGLDLDSIWREAIGELPGFRSLDHTHGPQDSHPVDHLLLFDQAAIWVHCLVTGTRCVWRATATGRRSALSGDQLRGLLAILTRLRDEIAAVRVLAVSDLHVPALQIIRSISEDVDMALVVLLRPKVARQFAECRSPQEAGEFWKRHVAGGRAFRAVAEQLYRVGLDYSEDSSYARWRKEVQVLLGAAVHTSYVGGSGSGMTATDCLYFAALRLQELCVYSLMLGQALRADLARGAATADAAELPMLRVALVGGEIVLDQMRWLTAADERDAPPVSVS
jgi:hypothetical protein